jgi:transcriptional regulator
MKRKLIDFDVLKSLEQNSILSVEKEIIENLDVISQVLNKENLNIHCIDKDSVTFVTSEGTYIHAGYSRDSEKVRLHSVQELVLDEQAEINESKSILANMVEAILEDNNDNAHDYFETYVKLPRIRKTFSESIVNEGKKGLPEALKKWQEKHKKIGKGPKARREKNKAEFFKKISKKANEKLEKEEKKLKEWNQLAKNVLEVIDIEAGRPSLATVEVSHDTRGNISEVKIPKGKKMHLLSLPYEGSGEVSYARCSGSSIVKESRFLRAINDFRRANATSNNSELQQVVENIVAAFPNLIYFTQQELSNQIAEALSNSDAQNWDDETCNFMAEGILRTAHESYKDRVQKVFGIAGVRANDSYEDFQEVAESVYSHIDSINVNQQKMYKDLYESLAEAYSIIESSGDVTLTSKIGEYLNALVTVLEGSLPANNHLAEDVAIMLQTFAEANLPMSGDWHVSDKPYTSLIGDNPHVHKLPKVAGIPGDYTGDYGSDAPVSDGKSYNPKNAKDMANTWTSGGKNVYPNLTNPYAKATEEEFPSTLGGDHVTDSGLAGKSGDTWPNLSNPYVPKTMPIAQVK